MAQKYLFKMEAVNLDSFIFDTQNLSTVRGGSLLLLQATTAVAKKFEDTLAEISSGASSGLFVSKKEMCNEEAEELRKEIAKFLRGSPSTPDAAPGTDELLNGIRHATFVVEFVAANGAFAQCIELLNAKLRFRQFQQPTLVLPAVNAGNKVAKPCPIDRVRPTAVAAKLKGGDEWVSQASADRKKFGDEMKVTFYRKFYPKFGEGGVESTWDLSTLSNDPNQGNLNGKIAVIYLDGNKFGTKVRRLNSDKKLKKFDEKVQCHRNKILKSLLKKIKKEARHGWLFTSDDRSKARVETLLWGGDELIWVVPAWKGWEVLEFFYEKSKTWRVSGGEFLTHAGGIVFCHHNAHIHRITALCKNLADCAKSELISPETPENWNLFQYAVLESFDAVGTDLESYRRRTRPWMSQFSLRGNHMQSIRDIIQQLKAELPRTKLHQGFVAAGGSKESVFYERLRSLGLGDVEENLRRLNEHFGCGKQLWAHLADLWDYIPEKIATEKQDAV